MGLRETNVIADASIGTAAAAPARPRPRRVVVVLWVFAVLAVAVLAFFAGRATLRPPAVEQTADDVPTVTVAEATVGRAVPMNVVATWPRVGAGVGAADGVLTEVRVANGASVGAGDVLFTVDLRPVVVAVGAVPSFRDLAQGARGADVGQLQELLRGAGHLGDARDGVFDATVARAVRSWQRTLGVEADGVVRAADLVWVPELPARVVVPDGVAVGARLAAGNSVVEVLGPAPDFTVTLGQDMRPPGPEERLEVVVGDVVVPVSIARTGVDAQQATVLYLEAADGGPVCGAACGDVPTVAAEAFFAGRRVLVPEATGPVVPLAALGTGADGQTYVVREDGERVPVKVRAQGDGQAVLDGVDVGDVVRVPGGDG